MTTFRAEGVIVLSFTSEQSTRVDEAPDTEDATENVELSRNILGLIDAYRMGAALDATNLYPARSPSSRSPAPVPATP